jgi:hypothetical protein
MSDSKKTKSVEKLGTFILNTPVGDSRKSCGSLRPTRPITASRMSHGLEISAGGRPRTSSSVKSVYSPTSSSGMLTPHKLGEKPKYLSKMNKDPETELLKAFKVAKTKLDVETTKCKLARETMIKTFNECKSIAGKLPGKIEFDDSLDSLQSPEIFVLRKVKVESDLSTCGLPENGGGDQNRDGQLDLNKSNIENEELRDAEIKVRDFKESKKG